VWVTAIFCVVWTSLHLHGNTVRNVGVYLTKVLSKLGYTRVTVLDHGQTATVADGRMTVTAVEGASDCLLSTVSAGSVGVGKRSNSTACARMLMCAAALKPSSHLTTA
jgi:hypothetical protein